MVATTSCAMPQNTTSGEKLLELMRIELLKPRCIGTLHGFEVWVNPSLAEGVCQFREPDTGKVLVQFSVDHPYIRGTKLEASARQALGK